MSSFQIRSVTERDQDEVKRILNTCWASTKFISRGRVFEGHLLPAFCAEDQNKLVALITYNISDKECEILSLNSLIEGLGLGTQLVGRVTDLARAKQCRRVWLITSNDNLLALKFYQKRGFCLAAVHKNALEVSRQLKPQIPQIGLHGIPLRDEIELEYLLV